MTLESMYKDDALKIFQSAFEVDHVYGRSIDRIVVSRSMQIRLRTHSAWGVSQSARTVKPVDLTTTRSLRSC